MFLSNFKNDKNNFNHFRITLKHVINIFNSENYIDVNVQLLITSIIGHQYWSILDLEIFNEKVSI